MFLFEAAFITKIVDFNEVFFNRLDYYIKKFTGKRKKIYGIENSNY